MVRPGAPTSCLIPVPGSACMESAQAYVGNFMHPREQKELTFLPCAGTCQLLIVFGSLCSRWALPVCQALCVGSQEAALPMMSMFFEKTQIQVLQCRKWGLKEHQCRSLGQLRPASLPPTIILLSYLHFHFCSEIFITSCFKYPDSLHVLILNIFLASFWWICYNISWNSLIIFSLWVK